MNYRFRTGEKGELVLQVPAPRSPYYGAEENWRDATVSDLPIMQWLGRESAARMAEQVISGTTSNFPFGVAEG
jgi:hypothetical protein